MNLREAAQMALEALEEHRTVYLNDNDYLGVCAWCHVDSCDPCDEKCTSNNAITALRAALAEDAMQRLTDVQQEMEAVTDSHEKEWDKLDPTLKNANACSYPSCLSTNGCEMQCPASPRCKYDHIADANKMVPTINEMETVEPVAYVTGYFDGRCVIKPIEHVVFPTGMALYRSPPNQSEDALGMVEPVAYIHESGFLVKTPGAALTAGTKLYAAPPKRDPLTEKQIQSAVCGAYVEKALTRYDITIARAIERAHGIGGEE